LVGKSIKLTYHHIRLISINGRDRIIDENPMIAGIGDK